MQQSKYGWKIQEDCNKVVMLGYVKSEWHPGSDAMHSFTPNVDGVGARYTGSRGCAPGGGFIARLKDLG